MVKYYVQINQMQSCLKRVVEEITEIRKVDIYFVDGPMVSDCFSFIFLLLEHTTYCLVLHIKF
jgi:hypothetical protein